MKDVSEKNYVERYGQYVDFEKLIDEEYSIIGRELSKHINRLRKQELKVLDVGCGTGKMPNTLIRISKKRLVFDYMDPATEALDLYETNVPDKNLGERMLGEWSTYESAATYDIVLANNALCGMECNEENMAKFKYALKAQGIALLTLPSEISDWVGYGKFFWKKEHRTGFQKTTAEDISRGLESAGIDHEFNHIHTKVIPKNMHDLKVIYSVMMYTDIDRESESRDMFIEMARGGLDLIYGMIKIR